MRALIGFEDTADGVWREVGRQSAGGGVAGLGGMFGVRYLLRTGDIVGVQWPQRKLKVQIWQPADIPEGPNAGFHIEMCGCCI